MIKGNFTAVSGLREDLFLQEVNYPYAAHVTVV